jgi:peptidoglycan hydrolase CwlO-like protein
MSGQAERALIAGQLADLTRVVEEMAGQVKKIRENADEAQERANTQQERIDIAARELAEVSARLQAAANALRESI